MFIRSGNIELRAIEPEDYDKLTEVLKSPSVQPWLFGYPSKLLEMTFPEWLKTAMHNKSEFYYTVKDRKNSETLGICAYQEIDYRNGSVTIWAVMDPCAEKDYGTETLRALSRNAFDQLRMERIALYCIENDSMMKAWALDAGFSLDAIYDSRINKGDTRVSLELYSFLKQEDKN